MTQVTAEGVRQLAPSTCSFLESLGLQVDDSFLARLRRGLGKTTLETFLPSSTGPLEVGAVWRRFLEAESTPDATRVFLLRLCLEHLEKEPDLAGASLSAEGFQQQMTWLYMQFMLGSALHDLGRSYQTTIPAVAQSCFLAELDCFVRIREHSEKLSQETQYRLLGMSAVAHVFLARTRELPHSQLSAARADLVRSIELGNDPVQALQYLIELDIRLFDLDNEPSHLRACLKRFGKAKLDHCTRLVLVAAAEALLRLTEYEVEELLRSEIANEKRSQTLEGRYGEILRLLDLARQRSSQDESDRTRLEFLRELSKRKGERFQGRALDGVGQFWASLSIKNLRLPKDLRSEVRELSFRSKTRARQVIAHLLEIMEKVLAEEPTSRAFGTQAHLARLQARLAPSEKNARVVLDSLARAREFGDVSPENLSLSSESWTLVWRRTRDIEAFGAAVLSAAEAAISNKEWGWPLVRLAELAEEASSHPRLRDGRWFEGVSRDPYVRELASLVRKGDTSELLRRGAERVVDLQFVDTRVLGGRSETFVLEDVHGLLERIFVLKPVSSRDRAEHERAQSARLAGFIKSRRLPEWLMAPEPVGIFDRDDGTAMFISRRQTGSSLADVVSANAGLLIDDELDLAIRRTIFFLAVIHGAWYDEQDTLEDIRRRADRDATDDLHFHLRGLGIPQPQRSQLKTEWRNLLLDHCPTRKRDAHAENWILSNGGIVAVDLASSLHRPFMYELAQLIEDFPLLPASEAGWGQRVEYMNKYVADAANLRFPVSITSRDRQYAVCAAARCVFVLSRPPNHAPERLDVVRRKSAMDLLRYIAIRFEGDPLGAWVGQLLNLMSHGNEKPLRSAMPLADRTTVRVSKLLAKVLRHQPALAGVSMDDEGWADLEQLIRGLNAAGITLEAAEVSSLLSNPTESRFELANGRIRARYGHSISINLRRSSRPIPDVLYHGTSLEALARIIQEEEGLLPAGRQYVHLVTDESSALRVGARHGTPVVLAVDVLGLADAGFEVLPASDSVWLVERVPAGFLTVFEVAAQD
jgi:putative RNA 2'-phosphotransferase